jgi:hypothetical protein
MAGRQRACSIKKMQARDDYCLINVVELSFLNGQGFSYRRKGQWSMVDGPLQ